MEPLEDDVEEEPPPPMSPREALASGTVEGRTVGVDPVPSDRSPEALIHRLAGLLDESCGALSWITSASVCRSLKEKVRHAHRATTQGDKTGTRVPLESFLAELAAQHNRAGTLPINDSAFWLLTTNAEFVLGLVCHLRS